ncbi:hypothetical protein FRC19_004469 [Serendipita sp. 401]|nr:hypothetical protein FRC19_004469 [Serendipita sp. 401]KAG8839389.1 hypothetical protein FRC18_011500 [Serendipita sp. 400]KAG9057865.1 hypothetical protein FS842_003627 [Serendipita sp. 407]
MPPKSIYRQSGAKKFQLVHRSQRDPLIHDPEASKYVFKELETKISKGKDSQFQGNGSDVDDNDDGFVGKAALYGIYYDDRDYDYTQHLRAIGVEEKGVESILIEAPEKQSRKPKKFSTSDLIPQEVLPSQKELPHTYESQQAIPSSISGFQPDMDPHLRQTLEALDDEAFVDDNLDDNFFGDLLEDGERDEDEDPEFEFHENGLSEDVDDNENEKADDEDDWETRFAKFKLQQKKRINEGSILEGMSEGGDTLGRLPNLSVAGAKKRKGKGTSDASGYSMSSSSMFRNEGLTRLDEQFERFEAAYASDQMEEDEEDLEDDSDDAPPLITTREDFDAVLDDFLAQESVGNKLVQRLEGKTPQEKLNTLRRALMAEDDRDEEKVRREALLNREDKEVSAMLMPVDIDQEKERWDCETILTTYSNLENHPRLLRLTQSKRTKKILLDPRTGLPSVAESEDPEREEQNEHSSTESGEDVPAKGTITRPKNETTEEKKARKQAIKKERQERRQQKKTSKDVFAQERKQQHKSLIAQKQTGIRKL